MSAELGSQRYLRPLLLLCSLCLYLIIPEQAAAAAQAAILDQKLSNGSQRTLSRLGVFHQHAKVQRSLRASQKSSRTLRTQGNIPWSTDFNLAVRGGQKVIKAVEDWRSKRPLAADEAVTLGDDYKLVSNGLSSWASPFHQLKSGKHYTEVEVCTKAQDQRSPYVFEIDPKQGAIVIRYAFKKHDKTPEDRKLYLEDLMRAAWQLVATNDHKDDRDTAKAAERKNGGGGGPSKRSQGLRYVVASGLSNSETIGILEDVYVRLKMPKSRVIAWRPDGAEATEGTRKSQLSYMRKQSARGNTQKPGRRGRSEVELQPPLDTTQPQYQAIMGSSIGVAAGRMAAKFCKFMDSCRITAIFTAYALDKGIPSWSLLFEYGK